MLETRLESDRQAEGLVLDEPVLVLTCARSGSTLLRTILDAHPSLACPPETNVAKLCDRLRELWAILDPACGQGTLTPAARDGLRAAVDSAMGAYLERRGKLRWCDKSLVTAGSVDGFLELYPKAKFICLYRHAMDVINSAIEATPWGMRGYGFDPYIKSSPTNSVNAMAAYWIDTTTRTLQVEERHKDRCLRVHYEELVTSPDLVANRIFEFIGVTPVEGLPGLALSEQGSPEMFGYGDHKLRGTTEIMSSSVGAGIKVPDFLISPPYMQLMNGILERLDYTKVDGAWRMSVYPPSLLSIPDGSQAVSDLPEPAGAHPDEKLFLDLEKELETRGSFPGEGADGAGEAFALLAYSSAKPRVAHAWRFDLSRGTMESDDRVTFDELDVEWVFAAEVRAWPSILAGNVNLAAALRDGSVRCIAEELRDDAAADRTKHAARIRTAVSVLRL